MPNFSEYALNIIERLKKNDPTLIMVVLIELSRVELCVIIYYIVQKHITNNLYIKRLSILNCEINDTFFLILFSIICESVCSIKELITDYYPSHPLFHARIVYLLRNNRNLMILKLYVTLDVDIILDICSANNLYLLKVLGIQYDSENSFKIFNLISLLNSLSRPIFTVEQHSGDIDFETVNNFYIDLDRINERKLIATNTINPRNVILYGYANSAFFYLFKMCSHRNINSFVNNYWRRYNQIFEKNFALNSDIRKILDPILGFLILKAFHKFSYKFESLIKTAKMLQRLHSLHEDFFIIDAWYIKLPADEQKKLNKKFIEKLQENFGDLCAINFPAEMTSGGIFFRHHFLM